MAIVIYAPEADDDLEDIVDYIAWDQPVAARNWLNEIRRKCETLAKHPEMGEIRNGFGVLTVAHSR